MILGGDDRTLEEATPMTLPAVLPPDEERRLARLWALAVLDTSPEALAQNGAGTSSILSIAIQPLESRL